MPDYEAPIGAPCWIELFTSDAERARAFYGAILGWGAEEPNPEFGGYANFTLDGVRIAGLMQRHDEAQPADFWSTYLRTDDIAATVATASAAGAPVYLPPHPVGDLGSFAMVADPGGAAVGLWQPGSHRGFGRQGEVGAPMWFELHADRFDDSIDFYRTAFGWDPEPMAESDDFRYWRQAGPGGPAADDWVAALMDTEGKRPEGIGAAWQIYFQVADTREALEEVVALGGQVIEDLEPTPYGNLAKAADPMGATFKISDDAS